MGAGGYLKVLNRYGNPGYDGLRGSRVLQTSGKYAQSTGNQIPVRICTADIFITPPEL